MSHLTFHAYEGVGQFMSQSLGYSQAVKVADRIEISGQGGWDPKQKDGVTISTKLEEEIEQAFKNVEIVLRDAGGSGWDQVYKMKTYHTEISQEVTELTVKYARKYMPNHKPIWTQVGVKQLGIPEMHIEVEVVAHVPQK